MSFTSDKHEAHENECRHRTTRYCEDCDEFYCEDCEITWANKPCTQNHYSYITYPYCTRPHNDELWTTITEPYCGTTTTNDPIGNDITLTTACSHDIYENTSRDK